MAAPTPNQGATREELLTAKGAYESLASNWFGDEEKDYAGAEQEHDDPRFNGMNPPDIPTRELMPSNYKDLRVLDDFFKKHSPSEKAEAEDDDVQKCDGCGVPTLDHEDHPNSVMWFCEKCVPPSSE